MDKNKIINKLIQNANVSYEDAETALKENRWDILDAIVYLEDCGKVKKPSISIYYSNEYKDNYKEHDHKNVKSESSFEGVFETICNIIDKCNSIFFEVKKSERVLLRFPITVMILLITFTFWFILPLIGVALIFDFEFSLKGHNTESGKVNLFLHSLSIYTRKIKEYIKKGLKHD